MNSKWMSLFGAAAVASMVGSTACIIVDKTGSTSGAGGSGSSTTSATSTTSANVATSTGSSMCVTCAEFYSNGGNGTLCPTSETLAQELTTCTCDACVTECGAKCDSNAQACDDCLKAAAGAGCKAQSDACSNDL